MKPRVSRPSLKSLERWPNSYRQDFSKYKAGQWVQAFKLNPLTNLYYQVHFKLNDPFAEIMNHYDYTRHFMSNNEDLMQALDAVGEPVKLYKTFVTVRDEDKGRGYGDLTTYGGFCCELLAWMMRHRGGRDFYVLNDWCRDNEFGEVVFVDNQDLEDFHEEFMPTLAKKRQLGGMGDRYFMNAWRCEAEYEFLRDKGEAPQNLWFVEVDWTDWCWFDNSDGWVSGTPSQEGFEVWLELDAHDFKKRFYVFDYEKKPSQFAFEDETDMILFSAWLADYRIRKDSE